MTSGLEGGGEANDRSHRPRDKIVKKHHIATQANDEVNRYGQATCPVQTFECDNGA